MSHTMEPFQEQRKIGELLKDETPKIALRLCLWLVEEVLLTSVGLDDLADSEQYLNKNYGKLGGGIVVTQILSNPDVDD